MKLLTLIFTFIELTIVIVTAYKTHIIKLSCSIFRL